MNHWTIPPNNYIIKPKKEQLYVSSLIALHLYDVITYTIKNEHSQKTVT